MAHQPLIIHVIQQHGQWIGNCEQKAVDRDAILPRQTFPERKKSLITCFLYTFRFFLLMVRSSMVSGAEWLISLLDKHSVLKDAVVNELEQGSYLRF